MSDVWKRPSEDSTVFASISFSTFLWACLASSGELSPFIRSVFLFSSDFNAFPAVLAATKASAEIGLEDFSEPAPISSPIAERAPPELCESGFASNESPENLRGEFSVVESLEEAEERKVEDEEDPEEAEPLFAVGWVGQVQGSGNLVLMCCDESMFQADTAAIAGKLVVGRAGEDGASLFLATGPSVGESLPPDGAACVLTACWE